MKNCVKTASLAVLLSGLLGFAHAARASIMVTATFTLSPDNVAVLVGGFGLDNTNEISTNFSTHGSGSQETLVGTSNTSFTNALLAEFGPALSYQINSATLTVGSDLDNYAPGVTVTGHLILVTYTPTEVTWNNRATSTPTPWSAPGAVAGTDYASAAVSTATPTPSHTTTERDFTGLGSTVQDWLDNTTPNNGLFFLASAGETALQDYTDYHNVVWTLDVTATLPEPASLSLLAGGALLLLRRRRG